MTLALCAEASSTEERSSRSGKMSAAAAGRAEVVRAPPMTPPPFCAGKVCDSGGAVWLACVCASVGEACGLRVEGAQAPTKQRRRTCERDGSGGRFSLASGGAGARARAESRGSPWTHSSGLVAIAKLGPTNSGGIANSGGLAAVNDSKSISGGLAGKCPVSRPPILRWCPVRARRCSSPFYLSTATGQHSTWGTTLVGT